MKKSLIPPFVVGKVTMRDVVAKKQTLSARLATKRAAILSAKDQAAMRKKAAQN